MMLAKRFAEFVLKSRMRAIICAVLFALLPYFGWISGVIVVLITLRKGVGEGFIVLLWSILPAIVGLFVSLVHPGLSWFPFVLAIFYGNVLAWLCAAMLLRSGWAFLLQMAALLGIFGVLLMHLFIPDVAAWWMTTMTQYMSQLESNMGVKIDAARIQHFMQTYVLVATGFQIMLYSLTAILEVFLGRAVASALFKPGQLANEIKSIRLSWVASVVLLAFVVLAKVGPPLFLDAFPVVVLPFVLAGISLVHGIMTAYSAPKWAYWIFYLVLIALVFFAQALLGILIVGAIIDSVFNVRARCGKTTT